MLHDNLIYESGGIITKIWSEICYLCEINAEACLAKALALRVWVICRDHNSNINVIGIKNFLNCPKDEQKY